MRALIILATLLAAGPAMAQVVAAPPATTLAERALDIEGEAPAACVVGSATAVGTNVEVASTESGISITLLPGAFVDGEGFPTSGSLSVTVPILCNSSHQLVVSSRNQGLRIAGGAAPASGFLNVAPYVLSVDWAGETDGFDTAAARSVTVNVPDAASGEAVLNVAFGAGTERLVAGAYSDELIVEVSAAY